MEDQSIYYKTKYPSFPPTYYPTKRRKKQSPTNELTDQVIKHIKSMGGVAYRINTTGNYNNRLGKWIVSGMKKGLPDVIGILHGRFIGIEINKRRKTTMSLNIIDDRGLLTTGKKQKNEV